MSNYEPNNDGIDHINVYSKAKTALGIFLSNFTQFDLETEDGDFASVEGYWYWLSVPADASRREELRRLWGWEAKKIGRQIRGDVDYSADTDLEFQRKISAAVRYKIDNSRFKNEFLHSTLPFAHYYVYSGQASSSAQGMWILAFLESYRNNLRKRHGSVPIM